MHTNINTQENKFLYSDLYTLFFTHYILDCAFTGTKLIHIFPRLSISQHHDPHSCIIFSFMFQHSNFLQRRQVTFDRALAHRQHLRHPPSAYCRRLPDNIQYFLLAHSHFHLRHISDSRHFDRCENYSLKLSRCRLKYRFKLIFISGKNKNSYASQTRRCGRKKILIHHIGVFLSFCSPLNLRVPLLSLCSSVSLCNIEKNK